MDSPVGPALQSRLSPPRRSPCATHALPGSLTRAVRAR
jgi:hypothetical protein